jgi:hypothetical protein
MTRRIRGTHDHPRDRHGKWTDNPASTVNLSKLNNATINRYIRDRAGVGTRLPEDDPFADDDPFNEDYGPNEPESEEAQEQRRYEEKLLRDAEKADRSKLHGAIIDAGGLKTRDALREEYREIPNTFKRRDGLAGDEMAEYLGMYYPELGIEDERDLIDYLAS